MEPNPCPFCGTDFPILADEDGEYVYCPECLCGTALFISNGVAVERWNARHNPALALVQQQAEDIRLWFPSENDVPLVVEALRDLHRAIEEQT